MKKWIALIVAVALCLCLAGYFLINRNDDYDFMDLIPQGPTALKANAIFMSEFFGIQVIAPQGWCVVNLNSNNFKCIWSSKKGKYPYKFFLNDSSINAGEESNLDVYYDLNLDSSYVDIAIFYNMEDSVSPGHIEVDIFAEKLNLTFDEYLQSVVEYAENGLDSYPDEFLKESLAVINEVSYRTLHLQSVREEDRYLTDYYICEKQGYYFCMRFVYWIENSDAKSEIISYINENLLWH